jgi:hypothetical protein
MPASLSASSNRSATIALSLGLTRRKAAMCASTTAVELARPSRMAQASAEADICVKESLLVATGLPPREMSGFALVTYL